MLSAVLSGLFKFISLLPLPVVRGMGRVVGFFFGHVLRHHRKDAFQQLERSIPELSPRECKRVINTMYLYQGINALELIWYSMRGSETVLDAMEVEGMHHVEEALEQGKGVIALTAHIGNFELMPIATAASGIKVSSIAKRIKSPVINQAVKLLRNHDGLTFFSTKNAYRDCLKALRRNEAVGMIIDQNMTRKEGIFADFFGKPACTSPGLAFMAAQSKAPVVPAFIYRKPGGGFKLKVGPPIDPPADRKPEAVHAATTLYNKIIEDAVREAPEQWIWMHRRWRTRTREGHALNVRKK